MSKKYVELYCVILHINMYMYLINHNTLVPRRRIWVIIKQISKLCGINGNMLDINPVHIFFYFMLNTCNILEIAKDWIQMIISHRIILVNDVVNVRYRKTLFTNISFIKLSSCFNCSLCTGLKNSKYKRFISWFGYEKTSNHSGI